MTIFTRILKDAFNQVHYYFDLEDGILSSEAKKILSNPNDREKYLKAIEKMKKENKEEETIILENGEEITLVS